MTRLVARPRSLDQSQHPPGPFRPGLRSRLVTLTMLKEVGEGIAQYAAREGTTGKKCHERCVRKAR